MDPYILNFPFICIEEYKKKIRDKSEMVVQPPLVDLTWNDPSATPPVKVVCTYVEFLFLYIV